MPDVFAPYWCVEVELVGREGLGAHNDAPHNDPDRARSGVLCVETTSSYVPFGRGCRRSPGGIRCARSESYERCGSRIAVAASRKAGDPGARSPAFPSFRRGSQWRLPALGRYGSKSPALSVPCLYAAGLLASGPQPLPGRSATLTDSFSP